MSVVIPPPTSHPYISHPYIHPYHSPQLIIKFTHKYQNPKLNQNQLHPQPRLKKSNSWNYPIGVCMEHTFYVEFLCCYSNSNSYCNCYRNGLENQFYIFRLRIVSRREALMLHSEAFMETIQHELHREKPADDIMYVYDVWLARLTSYDGRTHTWLLICTTDWTHRLTFLHRWNSCVYVQGLFRLLTAVAERRRLVYVGMCCVACRDYHRCLRSFWYFLCHGWWLRYKEDNMLMSMLIPHTLSAASQLKYLVL